MLCLILLWILQWYKFEIIDLILPNLSFTVKWYYPEMKLIVLIFTLYITNFLRTWQWMFKFYEHAFDNTKNWIKIKQFEYGHRFFHLSFGTFAILKGYTCFWLDIMVFKCLRSNFKLEKCICLKQGCSIHSVTVF